MTIADQWAEVVRLWSESGRAGSPWRAGMRDADGWRVVRVDRAHDDGRFMLANEDDEWGFDMLRTWHIATTIDPDDPATLGALVGLLEEVTGQPVSIWWPKDADVCCVGWGRLPVVVGQYVTAPTEAEALLSALIAGLARDTAKPGGEK